MKAIKQELFNEVYTKLAIQGKASMGINPDGGNMCAYRGPDGLKCGIGHLIPDSLYKETIEGRTANHPDVKFLLNERYQKVNPSFLSGIQYDLHDAFEVRKNREDSFRRWLKKSAAIFAKKKGLTVPHVKEMVNV